jgi:hypothetical protein
MAKDPPQSAQSSPNPAHAPKPPGPLLRGHIQHLHLAGTVSIPPHFPELGRICYWEKGVVLDKEKDEKYAPPIIRVEHEITHSAKVTRTCLLEEVSAIFIPKDPDNPDLQKGEFLLGPEIKGKLTEGKAVLGIVYVHERARTHTEVSMSMTAIQSIEFAPPHSAVWCE